MDDREASLKALEEKHGLYKRVFNSEHGQQVIKDIEKACYVKNTTFSNEALEMAYREGMRSVALHIRTLMELDTEEMRNAISKNSHDESVREES